VQCAVLDDQLIGPFIYEGGDTGQLYLQFLQEELLQLLRDMPLNKKKHIYFQHDAAPPHFSPEV
jgi:hypothetical protein